MKKIILGIGIAIVVMIGMVAAPVGAETVVNVSNLQPDYGAIGAGGVFSAYIGPPAYGFVSPGTTAVFDGREAGIIKAGFNTTPADDEGLFAFKPTVTIDAFAAGTLTYDVENQTGVNPVWMTIEIDTGDVDVDGVRVGNTAYQFVPTPNPLGVWNTFDAGAGLWEQWTTPTSGITTGLPMTLDEIATAHSGRNVVRTYLRLGMGDSYYNGGTGTTAWVDKTTIGGVTYDFVVNHFAVPAECSEIADLGSPIVGTVGSDNISGTSGNDLIFALGGSDKVDGRGGNDCIVGGDGSDKLIGGNGADVILGGDGSDSIEGGNQNDDLFGQGASDSIKGGTGDDNLSGGDGSDSLKGENGKDMLDGGAGTDSANGGANQDTCTAESENSCEL